MAKKIGALWLKQGKNGKFMSGMIEGLAGDIPVMVFRKEKVDKQGVEHPNWPDYEIVRSEPMEKKPDPSLGEVSPEDEPFI